LSAAGLSIKPGARVGPVRRWLGSLFLRVAGWKVEGGLSEGAPVAVVIGAPHTSAWDGLFLVALSWAIGVHLSWLAKHSMFRWPCEGFLRSLGAVPIVRGARGGAVEQVAAQLRAAEAMYLAIAPAGTRCKTDHWKSGFYQMATLAGVPIVCGYVDYGRRVGGLGEAWMPSGEVRADMDRIRAFYEGVQGENPELESRIWLREEGEDAPTAAS